MELDSSVLFPRNRLSTIELVGYAAGPELARRSCKTDARKLVASSTLAGKRENRAPHGRKSYNLRAAQSEKSDIISDGVKRLT
eukprot:5821333-Prymnesium_polylepis.2